MSLLELTKDPNYTNPELAELLQQSGSVPSLADSTDIPALRESLLKTKRALTAANESSAAGHVEEHDREIETRDGSTIVARVYRDAKRTGGPVMVMLHGGGFALGGLDNEALLCRRWCAEYGGVSVNVDYRLAPEHKFPVPVYDSYDAVKWTAGIAQDIGGDLGKGFIVAGISAGANMAAVISHLYRDEGLQPPLTGVYLSIPSLMGPDNAPEKYRHEHHSREQNKNAPILNEAASKLFQGAYQADPKSPLRSPVLFSTGHAELPPTYLQVCGMDPLRDDGLIYEKILREECGIQTKMDLYPGLPHGFWSWWPHATFSKKQQEDSIAGLAWLLERGL